MVLLAVGIGTLAMLRGLAASAAEAAPALDEVVVTSTRQVTQQHELDAASAGTVTLDALENRPLLRPAEVLEAVPGLAVTQHSGDGKANQYFLRGFNLDHGTDFDTYVAGMPVNMRTHDRHRRYP